MERYRQKRDKPSVKISVLHSKKQEIYIAENLPVAALVILKYEKKTNEQMCRKNTLSLQPAKRERASRRKYIMTKFKHNHQG